MQIQQGGQQAGRGEMDGAAGVMEEEREAGEGSQARARRLPGTLASAMADVSDDEFCYP